jgi:hypothetical protein
MPENYGLLPENITGCARSVRMEAHVWCGADRWSCPAPWMSIMLDKGEIRSACISVRSMRCSQVGQDILR